MSKTIIVDLDNTITIEDPLVPYSEKLPNLPLIQKLKDYKLNGFEIIIHTARNMRSYEKDVSKINANTLPIILEWLIKNEVPYDGVLVGKPWCGINGFYIDDKAVRPKEFINLTYNEILELIK
jgi:capsule biosynthesis phosphatase